MKQNTIIVTRNGRTTVVSGWRAWLIGAAAVLLAWALLAMIVFVLIGAAITVGFVLLLLIPAAIIAGFIGSAVAKAR